jgi:hypothetical protein
MAVEEGVNPALAARQVDKRGAERKWKDQEQQGLIKQARRIVDNDIAAAMGQSAGSSETIYEALPVSRDDDDESLNEDVRQITDSRLMQVYGRYAGETDLSNYPDPVEWYDQLIPPAQQAYDEFGYFRRRYFARRIIPWQIEMAQILMAWLEEGEVTGDRIKGALNTPPGGGKTTTVTHDFPAWLIARDRNFRVALGARTSPQSEKYVRRLRTTLERNALLNLEFGRFKPFDPDVWRRDQFTVDGVTGTEASIEYKLSLAGFDPEDPQLLERMSNLDDPIHEVLSALTSLYIVGEKEPTVSALSQEMGFLGGRYDLCVWDDLCDRRNSRTAENRDNLKEWWHAEAESRAEPGGLVCLVGTRFGKFDLYRHARDLAVPDDDSIDYEIQRTLDNAVTSNMSTEQITQIREDLEKELVDKHGIRYGELTTPTGGNPVRMRKVYRYVKFPAHNLTKCKDPASYRAADHVQCLLDTKRFSWHDISSARASDPKKFALTYQQEDEASETSLVQETWLTGGVDEDGITVPGCFNYGRSLLQIPHHLVEGDRPADCYSIATVDPSATNYWAIQWWIWDSKEDKDYLINMMRVRLYAGGFLDWNRNDKTFTGVMHEWQKASAIAGWPISLWIIEQNAAQRYLFQYKWVMDWMQDHQTHVKGHTTGQNVDEEYGIETLAPRFRLGLVDLPYNMRDLKTKVTVDEYKQELLDWPDGETDDMIMAHWFLHFNRYKLPSSLSASSTRQPAPHPYKDSMPESVLQTDDYHRSALILNVRTDEQQQGHHNAQRRNRQTEDRLAAWR